MASEKLIFAVPVFGDLIRIQLSQKMLQNFFSFAPIQDEVEFLIRRSSTNTFQEAFPRGAMRRVTVDNHSVHIKNNATQHA